jgi:hypothetical protein
MRNHRIFPSGIGLSIGALVVAVTGVAQAQDAGPPSTPEETTVPETAPAPAPAPAPTPPPAPAPAPPPAYPPPQAYPPPGPPPGYGQYREPWSGPGPDEPGPDDEPKEPPFKPGPYISAAVGYGAPLGAQTVTGSDNASIGGGVGLIGSLGYQIVQNFGLGAFIHWNNVGIEYPDSDNEPDESSAHVLFYGLEARGGFITDSVDGWASIGIALGTGSLTESDEESQCDPSFGGCFQFKAEANDDVTFGPMPTFAFGLNAKLSRQWGLGPVFRMYLLSVGEACADVKAEQSQPGFPNQTFSNDDCTKDTDEVAIPNVGFAGLELSFRP